MLIGRGPSAHAVGSDKFSLSSLAVWSPGSEIGLEGKGVKYKEKCFRCKDRTNAGLFIRIEKRNSSLQAVMHPICEKCALDFWRWTDEMKTVLSYEEVMRKRKELAKRETELKRKEANLKTLVPSRRLEVVSRTR